MLLSKTSAQRNRMDFDQSRKLWSESYRTKQKRLKSIILSVFNLLITNWRRGRDSNPRYPFEVYTLSRRALSTTQTSLLFKARKCMIIRAFNKSYFYPTRYVPFDFPAYNFYRLAAH